LGFDQQRLALGAEFGHHHVAASGSPRRLLLRPCRDLQGLA